MSNTPDYRVLRWRATCELVGIKSPDTLYRWMRTQGFPRQIPLGPRAVGWYRHEVLAWIEQRAAKREVA
jgi:prophage regulatory protein